MPSPRSKRDPDKPHLGREQDREWHDHSVPAHPRFAELCAMSLAMWTSGADPQEIADWLVTQQPSCPVPLNDQIFAVRGLKLYHRGGILDAALPSTSNRPGTAADEGWFRRNAHKVRPLQPDHPLSASFATVIEDIRALPETTIIRTRLVGPPPA